MSASTTIDLSAIPEAQRDAVAAVLRERDALKEANTRLEYLVAELNHAVHGKRSEKLAEDDRQLAFEDLEVAIAEIEEKQATQVPSERRPWRAARRNRRQPAQGPATRRARDRAGQPVVPVRLR
jgi:uncharacterized membrane protein